jgi:hypothetical protein
VSIRAGRTAVTRQQHWGLVTAVLLLAAVLLLVAAAGLLAGCGGSSPRSDPQLSATPAAAGAVGDTLQLNDPAGRFSLAATLLNTKRLPARGGSQGHGPLFGALLQIEDAGADVYRDVPDSGAVAVPVTGWTIGTTVPAGKDVPHQPDTIALKPGKAAKRWVWFDVAPKTALKAVRWTPDYGAAKVVAEWTLGDAGK